MKRKKKHSTFFTFYITELSKYLKIFILKFTVLSFFYHFNFFKDNLQKYDFEIQKDTYYTFSYNIFKM